MLFDVKFASQLKIIAHWFNLLGTKKERKIKFKVIPLSYICFVAENKQQEMYDNAADARVFRPSQPGPIKLRIPHLEPIHPPTNNS